MHAEDQAAKKKAAVDIWAKQYETGVPIADADIIDLETGERWKTGADGYVHCTVEAGRKLTLLFNKAGMPPTQTATVTVPEQGLTGWNDELTLQVPGMTLYKILVAAFRKPKVGTHHVVTTVSAAGKNLHDDRGEPGASVTLRSADGKTVYTKPVYCGTLFGKTEWLRPILTSRIPIFKKFAHKKTSADGAAIFLNVPPGDYILEAKKTRADGTEAIFTTAKLSISKNSPDLINLGPPQGPKVIAPQPKK